jgi:hypothetical protein
MCGGAAERTAQRANTSSYAPRNDRNRQPSAAKKNSNLKKEPQMEWKIVLHDDPKYAEVITSGVADKEGSLGMAKAIIEIMNKNRITKALIDHGNLDKFEGENIDIVRRPAIMKIFGAILKIRIAEIIRPEHKEKFEFLETVFLSQGFKFQIFQEREEAEKWLFE